MAFVQISDTDARAAVDALAGLALTQQLMRQPEAADETVERLFHFANESNDRSLIEVARSCETRITLLQGNLAQALDWAKSASCQIDRLEILIWLESPPITQSRVLIADGSAVSLKQADQLLQEIRRLCEECHYFIRTVLASTDLGGALAPPEKISVTMAKPPGATGERSSAGATPHDLTNRELDILEMLARRLQNKEIATKLFISTHTVNYHLKHIYQKLGVGNRRHAVEKAAELGILPPA